MTDPELREPRLAVRGFERAEPSAPAIPIKRAVGARQALSPKVFIADQLGGGDAFGVETPLSVLTELTIHKSAELPLCIGIFGAAGSGKSFALSQLGTAVETLSSQAASQAETPYLSRVSIVKADAAHLDGEPIEAIAGALCEGLSHSGSQLVQEVWRAVRDPHVAVTETAERLDQAQQRLHVERDSLNEVEGRRARLFDTLLYETPGSQVDAYARTYRPRIASRLQAFGFSGDPILNYKDLVASLATTQGASGGAATSLRTLWAFKGQTRLLIYALIFLLIGAGLEWGVAHQDVWLTPFLKANNAVAAVAAWIGAHMDWIAAAGKAAFVGAALSVGFNLWRAFRFLQPVWRGITLLKAELANRRHELENAAAHQTRRVDGLAADVERAARLYAEADQYAGGAAARSAFLKDATPFQTTSAKSQALHFVAGLSALISQRQPHADTPQRVVFMLDNLDAVEPERACAILDAAHRLLSQPVFVTVIAADPRWLAEGGRSLEARLEKWVQVPLRIDACAKDHAAFVMNLIVQSSGEPVSSSTALTPMETRWSSLDRPLSGDEGELLKALAPLAGPSARSLKRFVNLYRLTRPLAAEHWASLAFMLALKAGGREGDIGAMAQALAAAKPGTDLDLSREHAQLSETLLAVRRFEPGPIAEAVQHVAPIAASFSF